MVDWLADLLGALDDDRRAHSVAVGERAVVAVEVLQPDQRSEVVTAATLHDIGCAHPVVDFHPLDGASFLQDLGFSPLVCHLVAHHSASTFEAEFRGISLSEYRRFDVTRDDLGSGHRLVWWADLTTGPQGQLMTVEERLADIVDRHGPESVVAWSALAIRPLLLEAGQSPEGSIHVRSG